MMFGGYFVRILFLLKTLACQLFQLAYENPATVSGKPHSRPKNLGPYFARRANLDLGSRKNWKQRLRKSGGSELCGRQKKNTRRFVYNFNTSAAELGLPRRSLNMVCHIGSRMRSA